MRTLRHYIPAYLKDRLRPHRRKTARAVPVLGDVRRTLEEIHAYWRHPDQDNQTEGYVPGVERSQFLLAVAQKYVTPNASVVEVGCNVGRNLNCFFEAGHRCLTGIEISPLAVQHMQVVYPQLASTATIHNMPVEEWVRNVPDGIFDLVFAMAVFEHIHTDSDWVFPELARITRGYLITIEDERSRFWRHFPRNYRDVFERSDLRQIEEVPDLSGIGLQPAFTCRVFAKAGSPRFS